jgi:hypothetical protein
MKLRIAIICEWRGNAENRPSEYKLDLLNPSVIQTFICIVYVMYVLICTCTCKIHILYMIVYYILCWTRYQVSHCEWVGHRTSLIWSMMFSCYSIDSIFSRLYPVIRTISFNTSKKYLGHDHLSSQVCKRLVISLAVMCDQYVWWETVWPWQYSVSLLLSIL